MPVNTRPSEVRDVTQVLQTREAICPEPECSGPPQPTAPPAGSRNSPAPPAGGPPWLFSILPEKTAEIAERMGQDSCLQSLLETSQHRK